MNDTLRIGLIGTGYIGTVVGKQFHHHSDSMVSAITEIDAERRQTTARTFSVPDEARYEDYREMLDGESLDAILVGTPHTLHYEQILAGLEHDCHVFCNKPLATDLSHAREIIWDDNGAVSLDGRQWTPRTLTEIDDENTEHVPYIDHDAQVNKAEAFITAIEDGSEPPATARDALRVTAVTEAAYESARNGGWVDVELG